MARLLKGRLAEHDKAPVLKAFQAHEAAGSTEGHRKC
jgi:hypothetical protein